MISQTWRGGFGHAFSAGAGTRSAFRTTAVFALLSCAAAFLPTARLAAATATVDLSLSGSTWQTLRGFGGASVYLGALTDAEMDLLFKSASGTIGLTVDRVRISPYGNNSDELSNALKVKARGGIVYATPWSPPTSMKDNNDIVGGKLLTSQYGAYASWLNDFVSYMTTGGASIYAVSVQNEPDYNPTYESCVWTATDMLNFIKNNAGSLSTKVIAAESFKFNLALTDPTLNDAGARTNLDVVGGHLYGGTIADYALARNNGKEVWMTEHFIDDQTIAGVIQTAKQILDCLAVGHYQVWTHWEMIRPYGLIDDTTGARTKRGCVVAQYARWIRPGYVRASVTYNPNSGVYVTAFKSGTKLVVVAVT